MLESNFLHLQCSSNFAVLLILPEIQLATNQVMHETQLLKHISMSVAMANGSANKASMLPKISLHQRTSQRSPDRGFAQVCPRQFLSGSKRLER